MTLAVQETLARFRAEAAALDAADPLSRFRERFYVKPGTIYLDGNSMGLLSKDAENAVYHALNEWREFAIEGWTATSPAWFTLTETLGDKIGELIGAEPGSVITTGTTTLNLHQLLATLYTPSAERPVILADALNFPSDLYAMQSHLQLRGLDLEKTLRYVKSENGFTLSEDEIIAQMTDDVQMIVLPAVLFTSGQLLDVARLTYAAHERNLLIGFDLAHSIGVIPHSLDLWGVDFAFWCSYKYLNGGPGAVGGLYLNRRHWGKSPGLAGWFSNKKETQFAMNMTLDPADTAGALQIGTPHILSMAPLVGAVKITREAGIDAIRTKSLALTDFLMQLLSTVLPGSTFANPCESERRGGQVCLRYPEAKQLSLALRQKRVIGDFRPPDILRLAPAPLYVSFADCVEAVSHLLDLIETGKHRDIEETSLVS